MHVSSYGIIDDYDADAGPDWDDCGFYSRLLFGREDDHDYMQSPSDDCYHCPMRHQCRDGVAVITSKRHDTYWRQFSKAPLTPEAVRYIPEAQR